MDSSSSEGNRNGLRAQHVEFLRLFSARSPTTRLQALAAESCSERDEISRYPRILFV